MVSAASDLGWPCDHGKVAEIIGKFCRNINKGTQFKNDIPGKDFMIGFFKRHKQVLRKKRASILKVSRAKAEHPVIITEFMDLVETAYKMAGIRINDLNHGKRVFNTDESGFDFKTNISNLVPVGRPA